MAQTKSQPSCSCSISTVLVTVQIVLIILQWVDSIDLTWWQLLIPVWIYAGLLAIAFVLVTAAGGPDRRR